VLNVLLNFSGVLLNKINVGGLYKKGFNDLIGEHCLSVCIALEEYAVPGH